MYLEGSASELPGIARYPWMGQKPTMRLCWICGQKCRTLLILQSQMLSNNPSSCEGLCRHRNGMSWLNWRSFNETSAHVPGRLEPSGYLKPPASSCWLYLHLKNIEPTKLRPKHQRIAILITFWARCKWFSCHDQVRGETKRAPLQLKTAFMTWNRTENFDTGICSYKLSGPVCRSWLPNLSGDTCWVSACFTVCDCPNHETSKDVAASSASRSFWVFSKLTFPTKSRIVRPKSSSQLLHKPVYWLQILKMYN